MSIDNILNNSKKYFIPKSKTSKSLFVMKNIFIGTLIGSSIVVGINYNNHQKIKNETKDKIQTEIKTVIEQYNFDKEINDVVFYKVNEHFKNNPNLINNTFSSSVDDMINNFIDEIKDELNQYSKDRIDDNFNSWFENEMNKNNLGGIENQIIKANVEPPNDDINSNNNTNYESTNIEVSNNNKNNFENNQNSTHERISRQIVFFDHHVDSKIKESVKRIEKISDLLSIYQPDREYLIYTDKLIDRFYFYDLKSDSFLESFDLDNTYRREYNISEGIYVKSNNNNTPDFFMSCNHELNQNKDQKYGDKNLSGIIINEQKYNKIINEINNEWDKVILINENRNQPIDIVEYYK